MEPVLLLCGDSSIMFCCDRRITRISITISFVRIRQESSGRNMIPIYTHQGRGVQYIESSLVRFARAGVTLHH
jgi:hypothetical protein